MLLDTLSGVAQDTLDAEEFGQINRELESTSSGNGVHLSFLISPISSHLLTVTIDINQELIKQIHQCTLELFGQNRLDGLDNFMIPAEYLLEHFKNEIESKIKNIFFRIIVLDYLTEQLIRRKILIANYPRLVRIDNNPPEAISYHFDISTADQIELKEWKHFAFKSPKRKKYKDLDKQVVYFLDAEAILSKKQNHDVIEENDWVCFTAMPVDARHTPIASSMFSSFWCRVKTKDVPSHFSSLFLNKTQGDHFVTNAFELDDSIGEYDQKQFNFLITIKAITKGMTLNLDHFKGLFKLKNKIEIHNKLMEVFSYRNDISQRKTIIEEVFHLFLAKHRFEVPKHLVLRRQEDILLALMKQPDYQVYKMQKDFGEQIELLAEKQLKEEIIIDQIAYQENINCSTRDIQQYLHLFNNKRLREFIYFRPILERIDTTDRPINACILGQAVTREKTLNHMIMQLSQ